MKMHRTLYLNESSKLTVRLDGPSLWIKEREKAGRRVPFRLINQVIITGNIWLETGAIIALADNGVPVTFISRSGVKRVSAFAHETDASSLHERVRRLCNSEKGQTMVEDWLHASRHNIRLTVLKSLSPETARNAEATGLSDREYRTAVAAMLPEKADRQAVKTVRGIITGLFHEMTLKLVLDSGLDPHAGFIHRHLDFGFVRDLCFALEGEADRQVIQFFRCGREDGYFLSRMGWEISGDGMRNLAVRFENQKQHSLKLTDCLILDFFRTMREF